jgi:hypothetical protein
MDPTQEVLEKAARYVAEAQPTIDRLMAKEAAFVERVEKTAAILVNRGILNESKKAEFVRKCAESHTNVLEFVEHLAKLVGADSLGSPSEVKVAAAGPVDPFVQAFFPELTSSNNNGMVN